MYHFKEEVKDLVNLYRQRPDLFDDNQVLELERKTRDLNISFKPLRDNFSLEKVVGQVTSGFVEGMTTLPIGEKPRTTYESIAHSLGHLAGFAPSILSLPVKGAAKFIGKTGAKKLGEVVAKRGGTMIQFLDKLSVPMMFSRGGTRLVNKGLERLGANSIDFLRRGSITRNMADHAVGLASASAVSNIWQGYDGMYDGFIHGAIAGGAFGGVGNFVRLGNILKNGNPAQVKRAEDILKAGVGASITGLPSTLRDDPIEMQIYEYLLGGFFGYKSRPAHEAEGGKFWMSTIHGEKGDISFRPETHPDWNKYSKKAQDYVNKSSVETSYKYVYDRAMEDSGMTPDQMNNWLQQRAEIRDISMDKLVQEDAANYYNGKFKYKPLYKSRNTKVEVDVDDETQQKDLSKTQEELLKKHRDKLEDQDVIVIELSEDGQTAVLKPVENDYYGSRLGQNYKNKPANETDDYFYTEVTSVYNPKTGKVNDNIRRTDKPLDTYVDYKKEGKKSVAMVKTRLSQQDRFNVEEHLDSQDKYIFGGIKDKGVINTRAYHIETDLHSRDSIIKALSENNPEVRERIHDSFEYSRKSQYEWFGHEKLYEKIDKKKNLTEHEIKRKKYIDELHKRGWISNVLIEAERNNYYQRGSNDLSLISFLMEKGHSKNVIDWNKREQLYHDKSLPLSSDIVGKDSLKIAVYKDPKYEKYQSVDGKTHFWNSDVDGTIVYRPSLYNEITKNLSMPEGSNMNKPVIIMKMPEGGTLAVKSAGYKADGAFDKPILDYMRLNNIDVLMFESATKHRGRVELNEFNDKSLGEGKYEHVKELYTYNIAPESIRMNLGTFQNPHHSTNVKFVKQLFGVLNQEQAEGVSQHVFNSLYLPSIKGDPDINNFAKEFVRKGNVELLKKIKVDSLDAEMIHKAFLTRNKNGQLLAQELAKQIMKIEESGELEDYQFENFGETDYSQYMNRNARIMNITEASQGSRELLKLSRKFWENSYRKYMIGRYMFPKHKYSGKAWLAPKLPHMRKTNEIEEGSFMLDDGFRDMSVKAKGLEKINTLGQLWDEYQNFLRKKTDKPKKKDLFEDALEIAFIRVPADSMGGVRILKFKGFSGKKGLSAYTNAKDNSYIGGADKDSDSAFFYQGFDKTIKDAYKKTMNEWEDNKRFIDSKDPNNNKLFKSETDKSYKEIESKFSPSLRKLVAQSARKGQQGLGKGVAAKNKMIVLWDYVVENMDKNGEFSVPYTSKAGKEGTLLIRVKHSNAKELRLLGREIINRSADSADYSSFMDYSNFSEMLFNKMFEAELVYGKGSKAKSYPTSFAVVNNSSLGDGGRILSLIDPWARNYKAGRALSLDEYQVAIEEANPDGRFKSMSGLIGQQMMKDGVHNSISLKSFENYENFLSRAKELFKLDTKGMSKTEKAFYKYIKDMTGVYIGSNMTTRMLDFFKKYPDTLKGTGKSPAGKKEFYDWEKLRDFISNDMFSVASHRAISKKALQIYKALEELDIKGLDKELVNKFLMPLSRDANNIKLRFHQINKPNEEPLDVSLDAYDQFVSLYKEQVIGNTVKQNKLTEVHQKLLEDYFDMWLLSPFIKKEVVNKHGNPKVYRDNKGMNAVPFESDAVNESAIKNITKEFESIYEKIDTKGAEYKAEEISFKIPEKLKSTINEAERIEEIAVKNIAKDEYTTLTEEAVQTKGFKPKLERKAVTEDQLKVIKEFRTNLKDLPRWTKDFEDMFINWQLEMGNTIPKVASDISIKDMMALNKFWFDMKKNPADPRLHHLYYYTDPRTIDKKMQAFDHKMFTRYTLPVKSGDTLVKKTIKRGFSTLGIMREWFNKVLYLENASLDTQTVKVKNEFRLLEGLGVKDGNIINDIVAMKRKFGENDLKTNKNYLTIKDKIYKVNGKEYKGSELVEATDKAYTDYFKSFGDKWVYSNVDWTKPINGQKLNPYLHWDKGGKFDIKNFIRRTVEGIQKGEKISVIPLETILRFQYEYDLEKLISYKTKNGKIKWGNSLITPDKFREKYRNKNAFEPIGKFAPEEYFPQTNHNVRKLEPWKLQQSQLAYDEAITKGKSEKDAVNEAIGRYKAIEFAMEKSKSNTPLADDAMDSMIEMGNMHSKSVSEILSQKGNIGFFNKAPSVLSRDMDMPYYDTTTDVVYNYMESIVRSHYKNLGAVMANYRIDDMVKRKPFPDFTKKQFKKYNPEEDVINFRDWNDVWADYLRFYVRDSFGHKSTFPERIINSMSEGDPLKLKKNLYYGTSDQAIINAIEKLRVGHEKKFKMPLPFLGNVPKDKAQRAEFYQRWIHKMGSMEARYELMTLLANSGVMVGNLYGGSTLNIASTGLRNFGRAINTKYLVENVLNDTKGNPLYFYKNPSTGKDTPVKTRKDLYAWMAEKGVIDNFLQYELQLNTNLRGKGKNIGEFMKEFTKLWKKNPEIADDTILSLAKKYKVQDTMLKYGGWFMQKSERILRLNAFMSHALQARDAYGKYAKDLKLDDPYIMEYGLKGIEATQFLYHSPNRPAFMRTALGKVLSRFKLFVFNSVRVRKEMYKQAKYYGFKEGTEQFERFKDLMFIDLMTFALGSMFAYSLFDTALPPPWDFLQETSEWLYGDRRERERAFFGQYPYPIAPLGYVTPPIARIPIAFASILNGDHEKFLDYHIHTMYPFGRIYRQFDQTFNKPYGTTVGRGMQQFFRLPTDKLKTRIKKARIDEERRKRISYTLGE